LIGAAGPGELPIMPDHAPALEIDALRFRYAATGEWIVDVPSLAIAAGVQALLTGGSGAGKSTLLHLVAGLLVPTSGDVRVSGQDLFALRPARRDEFRGSRIGMIFQTFNLLPGFTAAETVMLAMVVSAIPRSEHRDRALAILDELGIDEPHRDPQQFSVGQQQRVAVARAIATEPALVLADEPTASLDPDNAAVAMDVIQGACERHGAALLCTSHDPTMQSRFGRVEPLRAVVATAS
jgi:putative ABC transport system ATP-binding protein